MLDIKLTLPILRNYVESNGQEDSSGFCFSSYKEKEYKTYA